MKYRQANHEDLSLLLDMERDLLRGAPQDVFWFKGGILASPLLPLDRITIAEEHDGVPVGMVGAIPMSDESWYLVDFYVAPSHRGNGVGRGLIAAAREYWSGLGKTAVMAVVAPDVEAMYERMGFIPIGRAMGMK